MNLFAACGDGNIYVWDLPTQKLKNTLKGHSSNVYSLDTINQEKTLISGSEDGTVKFWDIRVGNKEKSTLKPFDEPELCRPHIGNWISCVTGDESNWMVCGGGVQMGLFDVRRLKFINKMDSSSHISKKILFNSLDLISVGEEGQIIKWNMDGSYECINKLNFPLNFISPLEWNNRMVYLAGGDSDKISLIADGMIEISKFSHVDANK